MANLATAFAQPITFRLMAVSEKRQTVQPSGEEPHWYEVSRTMDSDEIGSIAFRNGCLHIVTLEGVMQAHGGDWIIQGITGELYPCKDAIFQATYERVEPAL